MSRVARCTLQVLALIVPSGLAAQDRTDAPTRVEGSLEASLAASTLAGTASPLWGLGVGIWMGERLFLGGRGAGLPTALELDRPGRDPERLDFGYGGLQVRVRTWTTPTLDVDVGLLVGAGRARLRDALVGIEQGADNLVVSEPALRIRRTLWQDRLHGGVALSYRLVWGVEDLAGLSADDLHGPSLSVSLSVERR